MSGDEEADWEDVGLETKYNINHIYKGDSIKTHWVKREREWLISKNIKWKQVSDRRFKVQSIMNNIYYRY